VSWKLIALVLPLGLDTLAVSAALGMRGRPRLRTSLVLAGFEAAMPLVGLAIGRGLGSAVGSAADWIAIALVAGAGAAMLLEREQPVDATTLALGLSVSLDELAIGSALGLVGASIWAAVGLIAAQAFVLAQVGLRVGARVGEVAERLAGVVLLVLAAALAAQQVL
jgi:manganese efflux pump family protein